jgi:hypothetical protein
MHDVDNFTNLMHDVDNQVSTCSYCIASLVWSRIRCYRRIHFCTSSTRVYLKGITGYDLPKGKCLRLKRLYTVQCKLRSHISNYARKFMAKSAYDSSIAMNLSS